MSTTTSTLVYASRDTHDGKKHWVEGGVSKARSNFAEERHDCTITNLASAENVFVPSLDGNGFAICDLPSSGTNFLDESSITNEYYKQIESFLLSYCSASRIVIFDHTIRRPGTNRGPIPRTHVDQTSKAAAARVERHVPELAGQPLQQRYQIINVWRPLQHSAWNNPLALCDFSTLGKGDMIETDRVDFSRPDAPPGETYSVAHNNSHRWYYYKDLGTDQVILIKCFDAKPDVGEYLVEDFLVHKNLMEE